MTLLFGIIEGGFMMRTHLSVGTATEDGVRRASVEGKSPTADFEVLQAIRSDLVVGKDDIERVIVYKPATIGADPPASCLAGNSVPGVCNVYIGDDLLRTKDDFGCKSALDSSWCPTTRSDKVETPDVVGVYIEVNHEFLTKFSETASRSPACQCSPSSAERTAEMLRRRRQTDASPGARQRGAAAAEFAILLPILVGLMAGIADFGVTLNTARNTTSNLRAATRQGAAVGTNRGADYAVLLALAAASSRTEGEVERVVVYRATGDGQPPEECFAASVVGLCNSYDGSVLTSLSQTNFDAPNCAGDSDQAWCPTSRKAAIDAGDRFGVAVRVRRTPLSGQHAGC